jgi:hypothetical protein
MDKPGREINLRSGTNIVQQQFGETAVFLKPAGHEGPEVTILGRLRNTSEFGTSLAVRMSREGAIELALQLSELAQQNGWPLPPGVLITS